MKHTSICLTNEMKAKVAATGRPMNTIVREACELASCPAHGIHKL